MVTVTRVDVGEVSLSLRTWPAATAGTAAGPAPRRCSSSRARG